MSYPNEHAWLRCTFPVGPFDPALSNEQAFAELLAKVPWLGFTQNELTFRWAIVDRPEAGSGLLSFSNPPLRPPPPDGLRYLPNTPERVTQTTHVVLCPTTTAAPTQILRTTVELTCYTSMYGHFPPVSRSAPLQPDSPELRLSRFRRRYHLSRGGGHPGLWLFLWGRDEHGGAGSGPAPPVPPTWNETPVRSYPLPSNLPTSEVYVFPSRNHPGGPGALPGGPLQPPPPMSLFPGRPMGSAPLHPSMSIVPGASPPYNRAAGDPRQPAYTTPASQQGQSPYGPPSNAPANVDSRFGGGQTPGAPLKFAGGYTAGHHPQQPQSAGVHPLPSAAPAPTAPPPSAGPPTKGRQSAATGQGSSSRVKGGSAAAQAAVASASSGPSAAYAADDDLSPHADILDTLSSRQLAINRFARSHDLLSELFEPCKVVDVLSGKLRDEAPRAGRPMGSEQTLSSLSSAFPWSATGCELMMTVEERRARLIAIKNASDDEILQMQGRFEEAVASLARRPSSQGLSQGVPML